MMKCLENIVKSACKHLYLLFSKLHSFQNCSLSLRFTILQAKSKGRYMPVQMPNVREKRSFTEHRNQPLGWECFLPKYDVILKDGVQRQTHFGEMEFIILFRCLSEKRQSRWNLQQSLVIHNLFLCLNLCIAIRAQSLYCACD